MQVPRQVKGFKGLFSSSGVFRVVPSFHGLFEVVSGAAGLGTVGVRWIGSGTLRPSVSHCLVSHAIPSGPPKKRRVHDASVTLDPVLSEPEFLFLVAEWVVFGKVSTSGHTLWRL